MYIPMLPVFSPISLWGPAGNEGAREEVYFFWRASHALAAALKPMRHRGCNSLLLPAYICAEVTRTAVSAGFQTRFYDVSEGLGLPTAQLQARVSEREVDAILLVHYFGFPQNVGELVGICRQFGVIVIEDCAHISFSPTGDSGEGRTGDVVLWSLWKTFPLSDGGALRINNKTVGPPSPVGRLGLIEPAGKALKELFRWVMWKIQVPPGRVGKFPSAAEVAETRSRSFSSAGRSPLTIKPMSWISHRALRSQNFAECPRARKRNFNWWLERLQGFPGVKPVFDSLPEGVVPFSFPVLVQNRDIVRERMRRRGVYLGAGFPEAPVVPPTLANDFANSRYFAENLLELPVHQNLCTQHLEKVAALLTVLLQ